MNSCNPCDYSQFQTQFTYLHLCQSIGIFCIFTCFTALKSTTYITGAITTVCIIIYNTIINDFAEYLNQDGQHGNSLPNSTKAFKVYKNCII